MTEILKCKYSNKCGNCQLLNTEYKDTLEYKKNLVNNFLAKCKIKEKVKEVVPSDKKFSYRNKMIIGFKYINGKVVSGFYEENSHKIVDIDECLMHTPLQNKIAKGIKQIIIDLKIKPYDEDRKLGLIRYVLIREAFFKEEVLITVVTSTDIFPARSEFVKRVRELSPNVKTIVQNINSRKTSIVLGDKERVLYGNGTISDTMCGLTFNITSKSFYQINPHQTMKLYQKVKELAKLEKKEIILDAYSGVGTIGMILSDQVKRVISVENNKQAVNIAFKNATYNKINNINLICDDATNFIVNLAKENAKIDTIVMDPPRSGSTIQFLNSVLKLKPKKIIYVSCNPETLARDLITLTKSYNIEHMVSFDMFCWTNHLETVVLMKEKNKK